VLGLELPAVDRLWLADPAALVQAREPLAALLVALEAVLLEVELPEVELLAVAVPRLRTPSSIPPMARFLTLRPLAQNLTT
jgi:hypothetical protein